MVPHALSLCHADCHRLFHSPSPFLLSLPSYVKVCGVVSVDWSPTVLSRYDCGLVLFCAPCLCQLPYHCLLLSCLHSLCMCACVRVCVCVHVCVRACVRMYVRVCVCRLLPCHLSSIRGRPSLRGLWLELARGNGASKHDVWQVHATGYRCHHG